MIVGADLIKYLGTWEEGDRFLEEIKFLIYARKGYEVDLTSNNPCVPKNNILAVESNILMASSTEVRERI